MIDDSRRIIIIIKIALKPHSIIIIIIAYIAKATKFHFLIIYLNKKFNHAHFSNSNSYPCFKLYINALKNLNLIVNHVLCFIINFNNKLIQHCHVTCKRLNLHYINI